MPTVGRFISVDPIAGGSANAYDYANADPVNGLDLGGTTAAIVCREHLGVHHPHKSSHKRGRVNAVVTGQCTGPFMEHVTMQITLTMYRNGRKIATEPTRTIVVTVTTIPSVQPTFKVPFHDAPFCKDGTYQAEASVTMIFPDPFVTANGTNTESIRIRSVPKRITC